MNLTQAQLKNLDLEKQVSALNPHISSLEDAKEKDDEMKILIKQKERAESKLSKQANNFALSEGSLSRKN